MSFYGYVHWRMTTEISVMYGNEKVKATMRADKMTKSYILNYHGQLIKISK